MPIKRKIMRLIKERENVTHGQEQQRKTVKTNHIHDGPDVGLKRQRL